MDSKIGSRVRAIDDIQYHDNIVIPKGTGGIVEEEDDGDIYFPFEVRFEGYDGIYVCGYNEVELAEGNQPE